MKAKSIIFEVLRWIAAAAGVIYLVVLLGGDPVSSAAFADVAEKVVAEVDTTNMLKAENQMVRRLYGLDPGAYEGCALYYPASNMDAEELLIVKLKDTQQQDEVVSAVQTRVQTQKDAFEGYGVDQFDLLSNFCVVEIKGNFALFVVSKDCEAARTAFREAL